MLKALILFTYDILFIFNAVNCQESFIRCELNGHNLTNGETVYYKERDQSIVVCTASKKNMSELRLEESLGDKRGIVRRSDHDPHVLGIWPSRIPSGSNVKMNGVLLGGNNTGESFNLTFVGNCPSFRYIFFFKGDGSP